MNNFFATLGVSTIKPINILVFKYGKLSENSGKKIGGPWGLNPSRAPGSPRLGYRE